MKVTSKGSRTRITASMKGTAFGGVSFAPIAVRKSARESVKDMLADTVKGGGTCNRECLT